MQLCTLRINSDKPKNECFLISFFQIEGSSELSKSIQPNNFCFSPRGQSLHMGNTSSCLSKSLFFSWVNESIQWCDCFFYFYLPFSQILRSYKDSRYERSIETWDKKLIVLRVITSIKKDEHFKLWFGAHRA